MKRILLASLLLTGCTSAEKFYDSRGNEHFMIQCLNNDIVSGIESCFKKANKICPAGWSWDGSTRNPIANQQPSDIYTTGAGAGVFSIPKSTDNSSPVISSNPTTDFQMISISCKVSK
jgi:hypothetical protein